MLTENKIHKIGRIDQVVRDYFKRYPSVDEVPAKDLMQWFIDAGIFNKDYSRPGLPIRNLLREMDAENKLFLLEHVKVVRHAKTRSWHFAKLKIESELV